ncbi:hypothetical protein NM688_g165 [Phlebia brevispora]|uniref:Uncharacterized protein n=1 Tax=Phlebia brevispora TaxID=194682 RepID=A0ACC1TFH4_9APHY|nr:hypothetical protein NM688_g165 [Phlebia brevispora]
MPATPPGRVITMPPLHHIDDWLAVAREIYAQFHSEQRQNTRFRAPVAGNSRPATRGRVNVLNVDNVHEDCVANN